MENQTIITEFLLLELSSDPQVKWLLFFGFISIYTGTLLANSMIILVIRNEPRLHTPMFFFLRHLAMVDICYSSVTVPKMLENFVGKQKSISVEGCYAQIFFFIHFSGVEVYLLSTMAYDRYVAICDPLHYSTIMKKQMCRQLVGAAWAMGLFDAVVNTVPLIHLTFCGLNRISHYTCELPAVLSMSCSNTFINYILIVVSGFVFGCTSFLLTLVSYVYIISTILKIHSAKGRSKAFSTCSSHLIVVCLFYLSVFFRYLKPSSNSLTDLDRVISVPCFDSSVESCHIQS
ncbi:olfactory receptor 5V1-like [Sceloporus undulatus]|uniref:olfactory receptor 5V1-like n=1 Tax=Sceloporus undulatus TaxID=8520 RepID=UPI001C4C3746|nr:olfactory receptor 5V1-like [Sceloporus undulatus]